MKKSILKLGKVLSKENQKQVNGGNNGSPGQSGAEGSPGGSGVQGCTKRVATYDNEGNYLYSTYYSC